MKAESVHEGKPIPNFSNYIILPNGQVFNKKKGKYQTIRKVPVGKEYQTVVISQHGEAKQFYIHKLVANAFVSNPQPDTLTEVRWKDDDRSNNHYSNLEWTTHQNACKLGQTGNRHRKNKVKKVLA